MTTFVTYAAFRVARTRLTLAELWFSLSSRKPTGDRLTSRYTLCNPAVLERREGDRVDRGLGMAREQFEHPDYKRAYDYEVDTSACTPTEGAAAIRAFMATQRAGFPEVRRRGAS